MSCNARRLIKIVWFTTRGKMTHEVMRDDCRSNLTQSIDSGVD